MVAFPITPLNRHFIASVEIVLDIAAHGGNLCTAKNLLARSGHPRRYLEPAMQRLTRSGILSSKRSPTGGYVLGRDPSIITLADILAVVHPPNRERIKREGAEGSLVALTADCLDGLVSKWQRDLETITIQTLLDRELRAARSVRDHLPYGA